MLSRQLRDFIAEAFRSPIDALVKEHFGAKTQEHQLTARIGQRLEDDLNKLNIFGYRFLVTTQDIPDKGRGALEKSSGIDLYVSISLIGDGGFSKGFFVQSKWSDDKGEDLRDQCRRMLRLSDASYAWLYGKSGVRVINATSIVNSLDTRITRLRSRDIRAVMAEILDCNEGDPRYGIVDDTLDRRAAVTLLLEQLRAETAVDVVVARF